MRSAEGPLRGAAVVCHPHPQHGGTMHTKAVFRAAQALAGVGFDALRFNFRGVGTSTGSYGGGPGEEEDVRAVLDWLGEDDRRLPILLGGFSFGARVGLTVGLSDERVRALFGLGLPLAMYDFDFLDRVRKPILLVQGEQDEYDGGEALRSFVERMPASITIRTITGADHYFNDHFEELQAAVREYFTGGPGAAPFPDRAFTRGKGAQACGIERRFSPAWNPPTGGPSSGRRIETTRRRWSGWI